ncbi:MAG: type II toxin-antitoxin system RelE/ParE family toxin [Gemmobacter sp.]
MKRRISLAPQAEDDLVGIWQYSMREWSETQAERYLAGLDDVFALLAAQPEIARLRRDTAPPVRTHPYRSHVVIFTADETGLQVIRVVHARSNWSVLFEE